MVKFVISSPDEALMDLSIEILYSYKMSVNCFHKGGFFLIPVLIFLSLPLTYALHTIILLILTLTKKKEAIFKQNKTRTETSKPTLDTKSKLK